MSAFAVRFSPRVTPLEACAALGRQEARAKLIASLLLWDDAQLRRLDGVWNEELIAVQGPSELLPWCGGVQYFGSDADVSPLLLPVHLVCNVPGAWLRAAVPGTGSRLLCPHATGCHIVPLSAARPVDRARLRELAP